MTTSATKVAAQRASETRQNAAAASTASMAATVPIPRLLKRFSMLNAPLLAAVLTMVRIVSAAGSELDGVTMPDRQDVAGSRLVLNGLGLRTYSFLRIHIYVAGLYLTHRSDDGAAILKSNEPKLMRFVFLRDVDAEAARKSWREGLRRNCPAPCNVPPSSIDRFLAAIPSVHTGDTSTILFTGEKADFSLNGRPLGQVGNPDFVHVILATFIGPRPTSQELKRGLLGNSE